MCRAVFSIRFRKNNSRHLPDLLCWTMFFQYRNNDRWRDTMYDHLSPVCACFVYLHLHLDIVKTALRSFLAFGTRLADSLKNVNHKHVVTMDTSHLSDQLNDLLKRNYDAAKGYRKAAEHVDSPELAS